jgi:beta-glucanase (GH16 family)
VVLLTTSSNGDFAEATDSEENVFIKDGFLYIQPTLQDENLITKNSVIDLTKQGCTGTDWNDCHAVTNTTNGTIVPPTKSARLITKGALSIQYGRVEVEAQLPAGDWLWPAIWMMPEEDKYGPWPNSGEIDIMESRGNNYTYKMGGNNLASSTLHWGPNLAMDAYWRTTNAQPALHTDYTKSEFTHHPLSGLSLIRTATWKFGLVSLSTLAIALTHD